MAEATNEVNVSAESPARPAVSSATHRRYFLLLLVFLHTLNTYIDRVCISAAAGDIKAELSLTDQMMGNVFAMFAIGYALFQIPAGWLSDRFGPRRVLAAIVGAWSVFTALTGLVWSAGTLLTIRFVFGVSEAGAFPGATRALYAWIPARERGLAQGVFHSGARVGAALSLLILPWIIAQIGWRWTFMAAGTTGIVWTAAWFLWYRDDPARHGGVNRAERELIQAGLVEPQAAAASAPLWHVLTSANLLLAMFQYAASNVTFFISFTWLLPYLQNRWGPETAKLAPIPLVFGMTAQWFSGWLVTTLHRRQAGVASRRIPAVAGFVTSAAGLVLCTMAAPDSALAFVLCFGVAVFGAEMTISPSWSFCMDIGGAHSGTVSGAMNMIGNLGSAASAMLFPWFVARVTLPVVVEKTGTANAFFVFAAALNVAAAGVWFAMNPAREPARSATAARTRAIVFIALVVVVIGLIAGRTVFAK